jgi:hypothetical protein
MKIQDLNSNDSLFIELDLNEAADVGGGMSIVASAAFQSNINRFGSSNYPGYGQVVPIRNGYYRSIDYPEYGLFELF